MGLDMIPMGKPKLGFEKRYAEIFQMITTNNFPKPSFLDRLKGKKYLTKDELLNEWFENQISAYETIKAPMVGKDKEAEEWLKERYLELEEKPPYDEFLREHQGFFVIPLAKEQDGVPSYISIGQDENVFRGEFLADCVDLIGEDLVNEAWETKLADDTLDYGKRLMIIANKIAIENKIEYLKDQENPPEANVNSIEFKLHVIYSLAKWLIFYGKNGHGYEADY